MKDEFGNYLFEYYVDLAVLRPYMSGSNNSATREFYHINPEIYWHGTGQLIIDYITIEDEFSRSVRLYPNSSAFISQLNTQNEALEESDDYDNLIYLMSMDEPRAGQLQMYKEVQNRLKTFTPARKLITAMWQKDCNLIKHDETPYNYHKRFLSESDPDRIMIDIYPLGWNIMWNTSGSSVQNIQYRIDNLLLNNYHHLVKNVEQSNNPDTEIFYIPQTFGIIKPATGWYYTMPPRSMIKTLKFLPLCYAADGIVDFCVASDPTQEAEGGYWVTPLCFDQNWGGDQYNNLRITEHVSAHTMIFEANSKIKTYGPIIRGLNWLNANKIMTTGIVPTIGLYNEDMIQLNSVLLNNVFVDAIADNTGYTGFVQCGYYNDNRGAPYFMLVNRRAVYSIESGSPLHHVDDYFSDADSQTVLFEPSTSSHSMFGNHVALYDMFDDSVFFSAVSGEISVDIGPGDGKLVQMCSVLPSLVTVDEDLRTFAVLSGSITIDEGAQVSIQNGTNTTILANSTILVKGGSSFNLTGIVSIKDNVTIIVEEGSTINFNDAVCTWGQGSELRVTGSSLSIDSSSMDRSDTASRWNGIRVADADLVTISDATISNAMYNTINNSNLVITNSKFNIPHS